ncbi:hypothetical protein F4779DRAFT_596144 [Xylariaceae sp. FL0662B]|nr:hypothetical protein F4779DRAFT_596144 [Xylariaceae sp. FL0662B]
MGWWDSLWSSSSSTEDPLRRLDPKLREFLEKESPIKYHTQQPRPPTPQSAPTKADEKATTEEEEGGKPLVPKESQFQDGRYAHLWKTYRPLAEIEAETKSDHERLMDVLEAYKERKNSIGKAALENCALEQLDWRTCMNNPTIGERMTLCRQQVKKFEKCYMTQTRLLKALGYLSTNDRSPEVEEDIQMHADALYHRLLSQEAEIEAAKQEGRPIPTFPPLIPRASIAAAAAASSAATAEQQMEDLTPEQREILRARLKKVAEEDRAAEAEAYRGEIRAKAEVASRVQGLWKQQEQDRRTRRERGEETMWDKVVGTFSSSNDKK